MAKNDTSDLMNVPMSEINWLNLKLGKQYAIKVKSDFLDSNNRSESSPNIVLLGTLDTFECIDNSNPRINDPYYTYEDLRDRIYAFDPNGVTRNPEPIFIKDDEESFNRGKDSTIEELLLPIESYTCYGSFVNVTQVDIEQTKSTSKLTTKDFTMGTMTIHAFIFSIDFNSKDGFTLDDNYKFYEVDKISKELLRFVVGNKMNDKRDKPFFEDLISSYAGGGRRTKKTKRMKRTKRTKKHNSKSRKQKRMKINHKKG
jgi:hypothetical protein